MINAAQYGEASTHCDTGGRGALPPASYRLATTVAATVASDGGEGGNEAGGGELAARGSQRRPSRRDKGRGKRRGKPTPSTAGGSDAAGAAGRGVYSFCMCPGGQIVPTSLSPDQLCAATQSSTFALASACGWAWEWA